MKKTTWPTLACAAASTAVQARFPSPPVTEFVVPFPPAATTAEAYRTVYPNAVPVPPPKMSEGSANDRTCGLFACRGQKSRVFRASHDNMITKVFDFYWGTPDDAKQRVNPFTTLNDSQVFDSGCHVEMRRQFPVEHGMRNFRFGIPRFGRNRQRSGRARHVTIV